MTVTHTFQHEAVKAYKIGYSPFGKPKLYVHLYYIDGLLIDTGQSHASREVMGHIGELEVREIFVTHHHEDHTGNLNRLQQHFNCSAYASERCCELMKKPPKISLAQHLFWGNRPPSHQLIPLRESIRTDNYTFQIIPIPGHAIDMVALYEPHKKWLFSADLYVYHYIKYFMRNESVIQQINSIKRILELDIEVLFCAHNPQFSDVKTLLEKKLVFFQNFYAEVSELHEKGYTPEQIFKQLNFKENRYIKFLSHGNLSKMNMVKSVIRDMENSCKKRLCC